MAVVGGIPDYSAEKANNDPLPNGPNPSMFLREALRARRLTMPSPVPTCGLCRTGDLPATAEESGEMALAFNVRAENNGVVGVPMSASIVLRDQWGQRLRLCDNCLTTALRSLYDVLEAYLL